MNEPRKYEFVGGYKALFLMHRIATETDLGMFQKLYHNKKHRIKIEWLPSKLFVEIEYLRDGRLKLTAGGPTKPGDPGYTKELNKLLQIVGAVRDKLSKSG